MSEFTLIYLMARPSNNGWKHCSGCIVPSKTSLTHAGAIVDDQSCNIVVAHVEGCRVCRAMVLRVKTMKTSPAGHLELCTHTHTHAKPTEDVDA